MLKQSKCRLFPYRTQEVTESIDEYESESTERLWEIFIFNSVRLNEGVCLIKTVFVPPGEFLAEVSMTGFNE